MKIRFALFSDRLHFSGRCRPYSFSSDAQVRDVAKGAWPKNVNNVDSRHFDSDIAIDVTSFRGKFSCLTV